MTAASGVGVATIAADGTVLDTWFPAPELSGDGPSGTVRLPVAEVPDELAELAGRDDEEFFQGHFTPARYAVTSQMSLSA